MMKKMKPVPEVSIAPERPAISETAPGLAALKTHLLDPDPIALREFSQSGQLGQVIPEWLRLTGPQNVQHKTHHFPLDEHTFQVIEKTKASPYYQALSEPFQYLTVL